MLQDRLSSPGIAPTDMARGLLLYERDTAVLANIASTGMEFDQIPFKQVRASPECLNTILNSAQYSMVLSNLAFDWVDAGQFIGLLEHLLRAQGEFWFSCYGSLTAAHTRSILAEIDQFAHFNAFYDVQDIGDALSGAGFKEVVLESTLLKLEYHSVDVLLADAYRVYGENTHVQRRTNLTPPGVLKQFKARVEQIIEAEGMYTEQVEMLIAHGRKGAVLELHGAIPVRQG